MVEEVTYCLQFTYLGYFEPLAHIPQMYLEASSSFLWADFLAWEIIRHVCMNIKKLMALLIRLEHFSWFKYL